METILYLVYEGLAGHPLTAAKTKNRNLIIKVAEAAITEAFDRARIATVSDRFVGEVKREDAERLQRVLKAMIPELGESPECQAAGRQPANV